MHNIVSHFEKGQELPRRDVLPIFDNYPSIFVRINPAFYLIHMTDKRRLFIMLLQIRICHHWPQEAWKCLSEAFVSFIFNNSLIIFEYIYVSIFFYLSMPPSICPSVYRQLLNTICGVVSGYNGKICTRSIKCPAHNDTQRRDVSATRLKKICGCGPCCRCDRPQDLYAVSKSMGRNQCPEKKLVILKLFLMENAKVYVKSHLAFLKKIIWCKVSIINLYPQSIRLTGQFFYHTRLSVIMTLWLSPQLTPSGCYVMGIL